MELGSVVKGGSGGGGFMLKIIGAVKTDKSKTLKRLAMINPKI